MTPTSSRGSRCRQVVWAGNTGAAKATGGAHCAVPCCCCLRLLLPCRVRVMRTPCPVCPLPPQVCAFIRAVLYDPEMLLSAGPLDVLPAAATPAEEARLLGSVLALYTAGVLPGGLVHVAAAQGYGALPEHADIALYAVWHHLRSRQRWTAATTFFSRLSRVHPPAAVWQAAALRAAGRSEGITQLLGGALEAAPESPALLVAMATECLKLQQVRSAASGEHGRAPGWWAKGRVPGVGGRTVCSSTPVPGHGCASALSTGCCSTL